MTLSGEIVPKPPVSAPCGVEAGGGKLSSSGSGTLFGLLGGVKPLGEARTTLTIGGTSTGTNEIGRITDGDGKLSLVKEDSGIWTLDGGNDFSGI